jgi:CBS domain-containing protein
MELDDKYRVQRLITRPVVYVHPNDTLRHVASTFAEESIGAALVRGPHGAIGLVSERDIVYALADDGDPDRTTVSDVMSQDLVTVAPADDLVDAVHRMLDAEVRHLPVMDDGVPAGMISARDAMRALSDTADVDVTADVSSS